MADADQSVKTYQTVDGRLMEVRPLTEEELAKSMEGAAELGALYERMRIQLILESDEARTHPTAAQSLALVSDMDADAALGLLASLPPEASRATGGGQFAEILAACEARKQAEAAAKSKQS